MILGLALLLLLANPLGAAPRAEDVLAAIKIPVQADALVKQGLLANEAAKIMKTFNNRRIPSTDVNVALDAASRGAVGENISRNMPNFGDFVVSQVEAGVRGEALAAAIHTELRARGVPVPANAGRRGPGAGERPERPEGRPATSGRPERAGPPSAPRGRP